MWESRRKYISHHRRIPSPGTNNVFKKPSQSSGKYHLSRKMNLEKLINPPEVTKIADAKMWWEKKVKTVTKIEHNRPDMIYWDKKNKQCEIIEISVPLDNNMQQAYKLKEGKYIELISQLQKMYCGYKYSVITITVECLGAIPVNLKQNILRLGISKEKVRTVTHPIQRAALLGSIQISKTILRM